MIFEQVKKMLVEQLDVDENDITTDTKIIDDLNADSIDIVEMLMALEDEYGIEISDEEAANLQTVGDIVDYIQDKQ
ncbi:MAG: acyl carrier protein [Clostridia bacterium]|nr:acyl carrier protein [Clostridia bacterium]